METGSQALQLATGCWAFSCSPEPTCMLLHRSRTLPVLLPDRFNPKAFDFYNMHRTLGHNSGFSPQRYRKRAAISASASASTLGLSSPPRVIQCLKRMRARSLHLASIMTSTLSARPCSSMGPWTVPRSESQHML